MSLFGSLRNLVNHDPVVRLLGGLVGHVGDHDGTGFQLFNYAMTPGETVNAMAARLQIPVDDLVSSNPHVTADTPLTRGLDLTLPTQNLEQILTNLNQLTNTLAGDLTGSRELPLPPVIPAAPPPSAVGASSGTDPVSNTVTVSSASAYTSGLTFFSADTDAASYEPYTATPVASFASGYTVFPPSPTSSEAAAQEPSSVIAFYPAASRVLGSARSRRDGDLPPPPLLPISDTNRIPLTVAFPFNDAESPFSPPSAWTAVVVASDGNEAKLQIMALLAAQLGGVALTGAGGYGTAPLVGQMPGFIDPQAVAAYAAAARNSTIDLGMGRSLQFSLVADRMRRVGAIGEDERAREAALRRTGNGMDEIRTEERTEAEEETQESDHQRDREQRRLAAVAAMRRRRRPRSTRCRCREPDRRPARETGQCRYPTGVDLSEFGRRQTQRYLWKGAVNSKADRDKSTDG